MLYRVQGIVEHPANFMDFNSAKPDGTIVRQEKKIYYLEADSFQKATTKAKKLLDHVQEVKQVNGEIVKE